ncbi:MAG: hypothetical protein ACFB0C_20860 [Leptolyngbyaceae cyanobacterium]
MNALNTGLVKLQPLKVDPEKFEKFAYSQKITYQLIVALGEIVDGVVSLQGLARCLGLKSSLPVKARVEHLVQKGALKVIPC